MHNMDFSHFDSVIVCWIFSIYIFAFMHCIIFSSFGQSTMEQKTDPENPKSWPRFILRVDRHMCNYLTSGKRTRLAVLSSSLKVWILLKVCISILISCKTGKISSVFQVTSKKVLLHVCKDGNHA